MNVQRGKSPYLLACCTIATLLSGCTGGMYARMAQLSPLTRDDRSYEAQYGPMPTERLAALDDLASRADGMPAEQQRRVSAELAGRITNETDEVIRAKVVRTLGEFTTPEADAGLRMALADPDADVRIAGCKAWQRRNTPVARQLLAEVLGSDTDVDVRIVAARALGRFEGQQTVAALAVALDDSDPALQYVAIQSLKSSSGRDYGDNVEAWRAYASGQTPPDSVKPSFVERWHKTAWW